MRTNDMGGRHHRVPSARHGRGRRWVGSATIPAIAGVLAMAVLLSGGYITYEFTFATTGLDRVSIHHGKHKNTADVPQTGMNILLVGDDHRPDNVSAEVMHELSTESDGGSQNTDTMIVVHVAADGKSASLISFPRDSYVSIPGHGKNKLNAAFALGKANGGGDAGGAQLLTTTIEGLSGLTIDHYVRVSLYGFYQIAQVLGPVSVCLNNAVNDRWSGLDLPAGKSELTPKQALSFVRQRHGLPRGDLDRQVRQQYFLSREARQILSAGTLLNPVKTTKVINAVKSSIQTDDGFNLLRLATQLGGLRPDHITSATVPVLGTPTITVNGRPLSIVEVDTVAMSAFIQRIVGMPDEYTEAKAADPADVSVSVLNGSGRAGAAAAATLTLQQRGFRTGTAGSSGTTAQTLVQYPKGMEAQAKAVAAVLPGAQPVRTSSVSSVTVVLGTDGVTVQTASSGQSSASPSTSSGASGSDSVSAEPSAPATSYGTKGVCIN